MPLCSKCGEREALDPAIGLCAQCLALKRGSHAPTFEEFKLLHLKDPEEGLFWADDALLQYAYYRKDNGFTPFLEGEFGADYYSEHYKLRQWYVENFFPLLDQRMLRVTTTGGFSDDEIKKLFQQFNQKMVNFQRDEDASHINRIIKRIIRDFYEPGYERNPNKYPTPDAVDRASDIFSPGSGLYFLELFFQLNNYDYVEDIIEYINNTSREDLNDTINRFRLELYPWKHQKEAIKSWKEKGHNGVVEMATATGKTVVGMLAIEDIVSQHYSTGKNKLVLVLCHSRVILNQWRREIIHKMGVDENDSLDFTHPLKLGGVTIRFVTIQSLIKGRKSIDPDLIIIDEVHHIAAPKFRESLKVNSPWQLGLTAQIVDKDRRSIITRELGSIVYQYPIENALKDGIIPSFDWVVHPVYLDITEEKEFHDITRTIFSQFQSIRYDADTINRILKNHTVTRLSTLGQFIRLSELARLNEISLPDNWKALLANILKRRQIINRSQPRLDKAIELAKKLGNQHKIILFLMDIESCNQVASSLQSHVDNIFVLHSAIKGNPMHVVEGFKNAQSGILIGAAMLSEGIDIPSADVGINVAFTKSELQLIQRMGRVLRKDKDKKPTFYQFVAIPDREAYLDIMDAQEFMDDLAWVESTGLRMGLDLDIVWDSDELEKYRTEIEDFWRDSCGDESIPEKIGSFSLKSALEEFSKTAVKRIPEILTLYPTDTITDAQWDDIIRFAHSTVNEEGLLEDGGKKRHVNLTKSWYILILCGRSVEKLKEIFTAAASNILTDEDHPLPELTLDANGMLTPVIRNVQNRDTVSSENLTTEEPEVNEKDATTNQSESDTFKNFPVNSNHSPIKLTNDIIKSRGFVIPQGYLEIFSDDTFMRNRYTKKPIMYDGNMYSGEIETRRNGDIVFKWERKLNRKLKKIWKASDMDCSINFEQNYQNNNLVLNISEKPIT